MKRKKCFKCNAYKPLFAFYVHSQMGDGHLGKCKACAKKDVRAHYRDPMFYQKRRDYEKKRLLSPERRAAKLRYAELRKKRHPRKHYANKAVQNALKRGDIVRMPCQVCGDPKSQAHHPDYRRPLYIKWLCFKHHRMEHGQLKMAA